MNIKAKILKDSEFNGSRLTTFELTYPRFIHSEFMTHRCFSRNAASSRAIPVSKQIEAVRNNPAHPERWGKNQPGMQAFEELGSEELSIAKSWWELASTEASFSARELNELGAHKQIVNRLLEPFLRITVIATAEQRGLSNFFAQRAHKDAQPEFQVLAFKMLDALLKNEPQRLQKGEWHIPMSEDLEGLETAEKLKIATGRIARVSYESHNGVRDHSKDIELHDRLIASGHWSPTEHCAEAGWSEHGNFGNRWTQYRWSFNNEFRSEEDFNAIMTNKPDWIEL